MAKKSFFRTILDYVSFAIGTTSPSGLIVDNREEFITKLKNLKETEDIIMDTKLENCVLI